MYCEETWLMHVESLEPWPMYQGLRLVDSLWLLGRTSHILIEVSYIPPGFISSSLTMFPRVFYPVVLYVAYVLLIVVYRVQDRYYHHRR